MNSNDVKDFYYFIPVGFRLYAGPEGRIAVFSPKT